MFQFLQNKHGNVAVTTALLGIPLALAVTFAHDSYASRGLQAELQSALDGAVLATVSHGALEKGKREEYARARFFANFPLEAQLTFADDGKIVQMSATAVYNTKLGGIMGRPTIQTFADSAATLNQGRTICVLALDESSEASLSFSDSSFFEAVNCSVQVNSIHEQALVNTSTMIPRSQDFCVVGGAEGAFSPFVNSQCEPVDDPYAELAIPEPSDCIEDPDLRRQAMLDAGFGGIGTMTTTVSTLGTGTLGSTEEDAQELLTGDNTVLQPGTYCDTLTIDGINVDFVPGEYHFLRGVRFKNNAEAYANNVTFILQGDKSQIDIETGAKVFLKAPPDGPLAGLAIVQSETSYSRFGRVAPAPKWLYNIIRGEPKSYLKSGGQLDVIGTVYLPDQHLEVSGESIFGARSRSTSFIAKSVAFTEKNRTTLSVDHTAEGLPPVEPRVETSPRLLR